MVTRIAWLIFSRAKSKRFPKKCYQKIIGETILERLVRKAIYSNIKKNDIFLCTSNDNSCDELESIGIDIGINILRGDEEFPIKRIMSPEAINKLKNYKYIVRICGDSPLYSFNLAKKAAKFYQNNQNNIFCITNTRKRNFPGGLSLEIYNYEKLINLLNLYQELQNEEHMSNLINFSKEKIIDIYPKINLKNYFPNKLTIDEKKDLHYLTALIKSNIEEKLEKVINKI